MHSHLQCCRAGEKRKLWRAEGEFATGKSQKLCVIQMWMSRYLWNHRHVGMHAYSPGILTLSTTPGFWPIPKLRIEWWLQWQQRQISNSTLLCRQDMFISYNIYRLLRFSGHARIRNCTIYIYIYIGKPRREILGMNILPSQPIKTTPESWFLIWEPWWWVNIPKQHRTNVAHRGAITSP